MILIKKGFRLPNEWGKSQAGYERRRIMARRGIKRLELTTFRRSSIALYNTAERRCCTFDISNEPIRSLERCPAPGERAESTTDDEQAQSTDTNKHN